MKQCLTQKDESLKSLNNTLEAKKTELENLRVELDAFKNKTVFDNQTISINTNQQITELQNQIQSLGDEKMALETQNETLKVIILNYLGK